MSADGVRVCFLCFNQDLFPHSLLLQWSDGENEFHSELVKMTKNNSIETHAAVDEIEAASASLLAWWGFSVCKISIMVDVKDHSYGGTKRQEDVSPRTVSIKLLPNFLRLVERKPRGC